MSHHQVDGGSYFLFEGGGRGQTGDARGQWGDGLGGG